MSNDDHSFPIMFAAKIGFRQAAACWKQRENEKGSLVTHVAEMAEGGLTPSRPVAGPVDRILRVCFPSGTMSRSQPVPWPPGILTGGKFSCQTIQSKEITLI
jgi:hypothetical protein